MTLTKYKLGDLIERSTKNNSDLKYSEELIAGVNNKGIFAKPKGKTSGVNLKPYKIVNNGAFVYNPTRINIGSLAYRTEGLCIVSHLYMVFYLNEKGKKVLDPLYLYIYFHRKEFQREVSFRNFGSQRPEFNFNDMSDINIKLPPIDIQQKYVNIYQGMLENQQAYETGLEDLKLTCDAYVERLIHNSKLEKLEPYIERIDERNKDNKYSNVKGISINKDFIETKANLTNVSLKSYKIVKPNEFAFVTVTSRNSEKITLGYNESQDIYLCSSTYEVFKTKETKLIPQYLKILLDRTEFDRYARFHSWGSARETFTWNDLCEVKIPIPPIDIQNAIADIYTVYKERKAINEQLKAQIKDICPILIKGSLLEVAR